VTDERLPAGLAQVPAHESPPARPRSGLEREDPQAPWTIDDLGDLPECNRYEIINGSLLVSPPPNLPHVRATTDLDRLLDRQAPDHLYVTTATPGVSIWGGASYLVPDLVVVRRSALDRSGGMFLPPDVLLVVEVLSPSNARNDLVLKRHEYAAAGIPQYWVVDREARTLTVLRLDDSGKQYVETSVVRAGTPWKTDDPFPLSLDPAEFL
jgi:Uma2 family endonuclease